MCFGWVQFALLRHKKGKNNTNVWFCTMLPAKKIIFAKLMVMTDTFM